MGLTSLFLFTLLGGMAAGAYAFEAFIARDRGNERPWLVPLVVVVLFAVGLIAATTHIHSIPRAIGSVFDGTVNFGSGMVQEVLAAGCFFVIVLVDLIVTLVRKSCPWALRVVGAVLAVVCMVMMGVAYTDIHGIAVWCNAPATVVSFIAGDAAMGLALLAALARMDYSDKTLRACAVVVNVALALGLGAEVAVFLGAGESFIAQIIGIVVAPIASTVLLLANPGIKNKNACAIAVCVLAVVGVGIARYAFYALGSAL